MGTRTASRRGSTLAAVDIFGNEIPTRLAPVPVQTPEPAATIAPPVEQPLVAPEVVKEEKQAAERATVKKGTKLTEYLGDPSTYPPNTYDYFEGKLLDKISPYSVPGVRNRRLMKSLGLEANNPEHQQIYAALMGISPKAGLHDVRGSRVETTTRINGAVVQASRKIKSIKEDKIVIENAVFKVQDPDDRLPGMAYAMLRRQAWAARRLGEITGKQVEIFTKALSVHGSLKSWSGVHVWPKIGYIFELKGNPVLRDVVKAAGFRSKNTRDLMSEKLPDGRTGYEMWASMVDEAASRITNDGVWLKGSMTVTDDNAPGLQVMQAYGRKKGLSKGGSQTGETGFSLTPEDDVYLNALWQKFGKKR